MSSPQILFDERFWESDIRATQKVRNIFLERDLRPNLFYFISEIGTACFSQDLNHSVRIEKGKMF